MPRKVAKVQEVYNDAEEEDVTDVEEVSNIHKEPSVKLNKRTGKPLLSDEERKQIRLENLAKAKEAKQKKNDITKTLKQSKKELTSLELQKQKEELEAIKQRIETINTQKPKQKPKPNKKINIGEDDDEDEYDEEIVERPHKTRTQPVRKSVNQNGKVDYGHLVKESATEQMRKQLENERIKMAMLSIMPTYRFN